MRKNQEAFEQPNPAPVEGARRATGTVAGAGRGDLGEEDLPGEWQKL